MNTLSAVLRFKKHTRSMFLVVISMMVSFNTSAEEDTTKGLSPIISYILSLEDILEDIMENLNITDPYVFSNLSGDCADYAEVYEAFISDVQNGNDFEMAVDISSTSTECTMVSNNIPNHDFNATGNFATEIAEIERTFVIARNPEFAGATTALSQQQYNAVFLNGVPLDLLSAGCYNPLSTNANAETGQTQIGCTVNVDEWLLDPLFTNGGFGADEHNAHTQPDGTYHYHGNPDALFENSDFSTSPSSASPVIGFAADGFPIYGSYIDDGGMIRQAVSGYVLKEGSRGEQSLTAPVNPGGDYTGEYVADWTFSNGGDLDECNGMTVNDQYGYYVTDTYPWVMACLVGTADDSFSKGGGGPPR